MSLESLVCEQCLVQLVKFSVLLTNPFAPVSYAWGREGLPGGQRILELVDWGGEREQLLTSAINS
jgi:hypothetical protein